MKLFNFPSGGGAGSGSGTVIGPGTSTTNALPRFSDTGGVNVKNSTLIVDDTGNMTGVGSLASVTANRAAAGLLRAANGDAINWRNAGNTADLSLLPSATGDGFLKYNGVDFLMTSLTQTLTNKTISGASNTLSAIADGSLSSSYVKADGTRPLTADWALGGFGFTGVVHVDSNTANRAAAGLLRAANGDAINWRNAGNTADLSLQPSATGDGFLKYNGVDLVGLSLTQTLTNKSISSSQITGTTTNDNAAAGKIGESGRSFSALTTITTQNVYQDLTNVVLAAGDYLLFFHTSWVLNGATLTYFQNNWGTVIGNDGTGDLEGDSRSAGIGAMLSAVGDCSLANAGYRVSIAGSTTYYLKAYASFSAGTPKCLGRISWVRIR